MACPSLKLAPEEIVTRTLPIEFVREVELDRRRREELRRSLLNPHAESTDLAEQGLGEWARTLPEEDTAALVDPSVGKSVRWVSGEGWVAERR